MRTNDVYTTYVSWGKSGKRRPVLIINSTSTDFTFYKITSQYAKKSKQIKRNYYPIKQWQTAGLKKQSYVDIGEKVNLLKETVRTDYIGSLTVEDRIGLANFIKNRYK